MRSSGYRGGGGGPHHHHHHHAGGAVVAGALLVGAAAAASRRNHSPQVVVVQQQPPVGSPGSGYYGAAPAATASYVVPAPVVVEQPPKKKRNMTGLLCFCLFLIAFIVCVSVVAWPGETRKDLVPGSQELVSISGLFSESVEVHGDSSTEVYMFHQKPELGPMRYFVNSLTFPQAPYEFTSLRLDLYEGSTVQVAWVYVGCTLRFLVYDGESKYSSFVSGSNPSPYYSLNFNSAQTITINILKTDKFYFVFDNNAASCFPNPTTAAFSISAKSFNTSTAFLQCMADSCTAYIDYGSDKLYIVLEPPTMNPQGSVYSVYYDVDGRWYSYFGLYFGLFVGMIFCMRLSTKVSAKRAKDEEDRQGLLAPDLPHDIQPSVTAPGYGSAQPYYQTGPVQPQPQPQPQAPYYPSYNTPPPSAPVGEQEPPPYAYPSMPLPGMPQPGPSSPPYPAEVPKQDMKFDPQTGLPL